jgi:1,4-alpha-glucan branching enzyme
MPPSYICLILHAHLPYARRPEYPRFLEENWLFEALAEVYVPLLEVFERLAAAEIPFRLTLSLSPTLLAMWQDDLLQQRYGVWLQEHVEVAEREIRRTHDTPYQAAAQAHWQLFQAALARWQREPDLTIAFQRLQQQGRLELITCAATHGYLPLLRSHPGAVRAQVLTAAHSYQRAFGVAAPGFWLPECGYYPGLEHILAEAGFGYFILDTHGIENAAPRPRDGFYAPLLCRNGVAAFGRDPAASRQVWSAEQGYPGDPAYREFYRDTGFELSQEQLKPLPAGHYSGFKYWRVTGKTEAKQPYNPTAAWQRAKIHAAHFIQQRQRELRRQSLHRIQPPLAVCPYDAELFGHWWFEGPIWLEQVLRGLAAQTLIESITPADYSRRHGGLQIAQPAASSWGWQGYNAFWLNPGNDWIYPRLRQAAEEMQRLTAMAAPDSLSQRALRQAGRTLLLAQASDWPFMIKSGTNAEFAAATVRGLLARFDYLADGLRRNQLVEREVAALEYLDKIFPELDCGVFADYPEN